MDMKAEPDPGNHTDNELNTAFDSCIANAEDQVRALKQARELASKISRSVYKNRRLEPTKVDQQCITLTKDAYISLLDSFCRIFTAMHELENPPRSKQSANRADKGSITELQDLALKSLKDVEGFELASTRSPPISSAQNDSHSHSLNGRGETQQTTSAEPKQQGDSDGSTSTGVTNTVPTSSSQTEASQSASTRANTSTKNRAKRSAAQMDDATADQPKPSPENADIGRSKRQRTSRESSPPSAPSRTSHSPTITPSARSSSQRPYPEAEQTPRQPQFASYPDPSASVTALTSPLKRRPDDADDTQRSEVRSNKYVRLRDGDSTIRQRLDELNLQYDLARGTPDLADYSGVSFIDVTEQAAARIRAREESRREKSKASIGKRARSHEAEDTDRNTDEAPLITPSSKRSKKHNLLNDVSPAYGVRGSQR